MEEEIERGRGGREREGGDRGQERGLKEGNTVEEDNRTEQTKFLHLHK